MATRLVDLSHEIEAGLVTYPGLPAPVVSDFLTRDASQAHYAPGTTFHIARIDMVANTGTYVDSPFHRYAEGADVAALPLERLAELDGVVIDATGRAGRAIDADVFAGRELRGQAVLVRTGWDRHWRTPGYADGHPFLTRQSVERLVAAGPFPGRRLFRPNLRTAEMGPGPTWSASRSAARRSSGPAAGGRTASGRRRGPSRAR